MHTHAERLRGLIAEGQALVRRCLRRNQPGPYQIQAAINAVHSAAPTAAATDWRQILASQPDASLTVWDSVSSQLTLNIMLWATLIFMPIIIFYTSWAYRVMGGKVTAAYVRENEHSAY